MIESLYWGDMAVAFFIGFLFNLPFAVIVLLIHNDYLLLIFGFILFAIALICISLERRRF